MKLKCLLFITLLFLSVNTFSADAKSNTIAGVFNFSPGVLLKQVSEVAEKLKKLDPNFSSIIVAGIDKNAFGIYVSYKANDKIWRTNDLSKLVKSAASSLKSGYEGYSLGGEAIVIK
jgi:hypothetical protein